MGSGFSADQAACTPFGHQGLTPKALPHRAVGRSQHRRGLKRTRHQRHRSHVGTVIGVLGSYINRHVFAYRNDSDAGRRVCVVADRSMISAETIAGLEARKLEYLLGARERSDALLKTIVLANDDPFVPLLIERRSARENHRRPRCAIEEGRPGSHRQLGLSALAQAGVRDRCRQACARKRQ